MPATRSRLKKLTEPSRARLLWMLVLPALAQAQPAPPIAPPIAPQIKLSAQQQARAGIQTEVALGAPVGAAATATATAGATTGAAPEQGLRLSGTVRAPAGAVSLVSAVVAGVVQKIHVDSLQQVRAGTPVATLFSQQLLEIEREYLQLATQARLARDKLARDEALFKEGIIADGRLQESGAAATLAEVAAGERRQALRAAGLGEAAIAHLLSSKTLSPYLTLAAGARGALLELHVQIGQRIEAGMPVATIGQDVPLWIEFQAARQQAGQIRVGDRLQVKNCGGATVLALAPHMDGANQSTLIRAREDRHDGCLKVNQFVEASHVGRRAAAGSVGVPPGAVVRQGDAQYVFVQTGAGFEAVKVGVVPGPPERVWVSGAVNPGQRVATRGLVALKGAWIGLGGEAPPVEAGAPGAAPARQNSERK